MPRIIIARQQHRGYYADAKVLGTGLKSTVEIAKVCARYSNFVAIEHNVVFIW